jgi:hypothetical protein
MLALEEEMGATSSWEACCLQPAGVVKTRLQLDRARRHDCTRESVVTHLLTPRSARSLLQDPTTGALSTAALFTSGLGARLRRSAEALLVVTPFKVVKIRLQQQWGCLGPRPGHAVEVPGPVH